MAFEHRCSERMESRLEKPTRPFYRVHALRCGSLYERVLFDETATVRWHRNEYSDSIEIKRVFCLRGSFNVNSRNISIGLEMRVLHSRLKYIKQKKILDNLTAERRRVPPICLSLFVHRSLCSHRIHCQTFVSLLTSEVH